MAEKPQHVATEAELAAQRKHPAYDYGYSHGWADCFEETKRRFLAGELPEWETPVRAEALEKAAQVCDALYDAYSTTSTDQTDPEQVWLDACDRAATAIRALKGKRAIIDYRDAIRMLKEKGKE